MNNSKEIINMINQQNSKTDSHRYVEIFYRSLIIICTLSAIGLFIRFLVSL